MAKEEPLKSEDKATVYLDNSLNGMCLADELRDVMDESFNPLPLPRLAQKSRKRPSSILSVALAKMDQSSKNCDESSVSEPVKKTRLSMQTSSDSTSSASCADEVLVIHEDLIRLQVS